MTVFHKTQIEAKIKQLDEFYAQLKEALQGRAVHPDIGRYYVTRRDEVKNLVEIDIGKLLDGIGHYRVSLDSLARLRSEAKRPAKSPLFFEEDTPY